MSSFRHEAILTGNWRPALSFQNLEPTLVKTLYRFMVRLRRCELALIAAYRSKKEIRCPVHFCLGQEAGSAALSTLLRLDDYLFCHHRCHGYYLAKGAPMSAMFAELYGRRTGANGGMAGSQEISMAEVNFYSGAILTGAVGMAVGVALAHQLRKQDTIVCAGFGEGATDEGLFWEAVSYASLRRLPIVFLCENNSYTTYAPQPKHQPSEIHHRVASFGVTSSAVFGNDVTELYRVLKQACERARSGGGPTFVEAYTYRWNGHVGPENDEEVGYRSDAEIDFWKQYCPIKLLEESMIAARLLDQEKKDQVYREIETEIEEAFAFARESPFPESASWQELNYCGDSPLADRLLHDVEGTAFDQNQQEAIPGPY
jgi:acetoin:2,6-dichlorophenolindophenol oxidoreductase subunit alpha